MDKTNLCGGVGAANIVESVACPEFSVVRAIGKQGEQPIDEPRVAPYTL